MFPEPDLVDTSSGIHCEYSAPDTVQASIGNGDTLAGTSPNRAVPDGTLQGENSSASSIPSILPLWPGKRSKHIILKKSVEPRN